MEKFKIIFFSFFIILTNYIDGWSQNDFLNSRFAVISTNYALQCLKCKDISEELYTQFKRESIFNSSDLYPNWKALWISNNWETARQSRYRGVDFFLTSEVVRKAQDYEITFILYDKNKKPYQAENFIQEIRTSQLQIDIRNVTEIILNELNDFKSKGHFKKAIIVDNFDIMQSIDLNPTYTEKFSDWLASELKNNDIISLNYHIYYVKEINSDDIENKVDGEFYQKNETKLKMTMEIELTGKRKTCKTLIINMSDYRDINRNEILEEILDKIDELENEN